MSSQSVKSSQSNADGQNSGQNTEAGPDADVVVTGRNVEIPDHYRVYVGQKLALSLIHI